MGTQPPTADPPHFRPMPIVAKRSPISAAAELLLILGPHHIFGMGEGRQLTFGVLVDIDEY